VANLILKKEGNAGEKRANGCACHIIGNEIIVGFDKPKIMHCSFNKE